MAKKLGRGLSNLIPGAENKTASVEVNQNPDYQEIDINKLSPNPEQPRKKFVQQELEELAATLHNVGLIEPIVVRKMDDRFQIISGERRWRACKIAGFKKIPCVIKNVNDIQALEMGIIENIQREELSPIEEARAYDHLIEKTGIKPGDLSARVGKDRSTITNLLRLLKLPPEIIELIENGKISAGQARPLLGIGDRNKLHSLVKKIITEGWTARKVEEEVARIHEPALGKQNSQNKKDVNIAKIEDRLRVKLTTRVSISHKKNGSGKISIGYANLDDLERILEMIGK
ncbi:MAG: ParB/RepB/Spo0J family partition protein [Spirochaetia bacterium]|nr:ParB/RepB/Spo0J family partition protein [Spirochaetia bacterium]